MLLDGYATIRDMEKIRVEAVLPFLRYVCCRSMFYHLNHAFLGDAYRLECLEKFPLRKWIAIKKSVCAFAVSLRSFDKSSEALIR